MERDVENAIISNLQKFLLEMGWGFCFVDRQMYISTESLQADIVAREQVLRDKSLNYCRNRGIEFG